MWSSGQGQQLEFTDKWSFGFVVCTLSSGAVALAETQGPAPKIVNGYESAPGARPYIGSYQIFLDDTWQHICGCTLVTPNKVITAAHCVVAFPGIPWRVQFGSNQLFDQTSPHVQYRNVSASEPHEGYYPGDNYPNDIAIMTLERSVRITDYVQLAKLSEHRGYPYPGDTCLIVGWGKTKQFNPDYSPELREARTVVLDTETCNNLFQTLAGDYYDPTLVADSNQVCLSDRSQSTGTKPTACFGDSGGPLMCGRGFKYLSGVTSWAYSCDGETPVVYTRVSSYVKWIHERLSLVGELAGGL
ncbi:fibrinolytic enzyme, isozyme C-like [Physella acuta]|uniref:fibrinolytic enzyme, isozyme C-like n=1 Tax=Physella acuta TaxID=109671 RepID=UPI0027DD5F6A|nr:fibrinolytic enzyme, isozyme C-like [Physella acuta]